MATGLPVTWSEEEHIAWKTPIHGKAWSSPVIWDDQIWMTSATENGKQRFAVCVDRESGKIVYDILLYEIPEPQFCHHVQQLCQLHAGDRGRPRLCALRQRRHRLHRYRHGQSAVEPRGLGVRPFSRRRVVAYPVWNLLVVALDGYDYQYVVAFDKTTGKTVWRKDRNIQYDSDEGDIKKGYCTATVIEVDGQQQLVYPERGRHHCL